MGASDELLELEREGWVALSSGGDAAVAFYGEVLAREVLMLLPGGMVIDERDAAIEAMSGAPWSTYALVDERVVVLGADAAAVTYRASAGGWRSTSRPRSEAGDRSSGEGRLAPDSAPWSPSTSSWPEPRSPTSSSASPGGPIASTRS